MNVSELSDDLAQTMARQLRLRNGSLPEVVDRAGRKLPRHLRQAAAIITEAEGLSQHPKLAYRIDAKSVKRAERNLRRFLDKQDPKAERMAAFLDRLAAVVFILLTLVLAVFFTALSRGYFD